MAPEYRKYAVFLCKFYFQGGNRYRRTRLSEWKWVKFWHFPRILRKHVKINRTDNWENSKLIFLNFSEKVRTSPISTILIVFYDIDSHLFMVETKKVSPNKWTGCKKSLVIVLKPLYLILYLSILMWRKGFITPVHVFGETYLLSTFNRGESMS